ncbi:SgcJ/EcaC family oxidoreductase [Actinoplanes siamensis]|uniref:DUF4440 domain-containing protein n=1 Tax=Actinoplanes siamensis TaxID=1223317 RepID=A0A919N9I1_9ACTN|nr:SgcJ/EcaC family oxidoreductase [Actinoplanes siamensis]GIF07017.1 hypothetical protein Asi03nite_45550 [Actinoplanes siamensis]
MTSSSTGAAAVAPPGPDRQALLAVPARLTEVWAAQDADGFADLFLDDGTMILPGVYAHGRDEIRSFMAEAFAGRYRGTRVTGSPIDVKVLAPDVVALITTGGVLAAGEQEVSAEAAIRASWILVKRDTRWALAVYQNCPREPAR